jgi:glycosyltransferase involved in cell wall biosynthesis
MKICHITSVHPVLDIRIFHKECVSLADAGYDVTLVCTGKTNHTFVEKGVKIIQRAVDNQTRTGRMFHTANIVCDAALKENADIYHLHDPELMRIIPRLKKCNKKVIFDAHEDFPGQILGKHYIPLFLRKLISFAARITENLLLPKADAIITAVESNSIKMNRLSKIIVTLNNYPILNEFADSVPHDYSKKNICYIGSISLLRGIKEAISAAYISNTRLFLAGPFSPPELEKEMAKTAGWNNVEYFGFSDRTKIIGILAESSVGLATIHNSENFILNPVTKIFEYMAAGLPVIASDFPLWKTIVEGNNCGLCVNPLNPDEIAGAISFILSNPDRAREMGANGRKAFLEKYNWETEKQKLIDLYKLLSC